MLSLCAVYESVLPIASAEVIPLQLYVEATEIPAVLSSRTMRECTNTNPRLPLVYLITCITAMAKLFV